MNTNKQLNDILNKFPKKTELENHKIALSKIDDIEEEISRGYAMEDFIRDALDEADEKIGKARTILITDMTDAYIRADNLLRELKDELDELGVDSPKYNQLAKENQGLNDLIDKMDLIIKKGF